MSRINQIQTRILELSGGAFQKLADAYIVKKGYDQINALGSVAGADKARPGTPDSLAKLPSGKYAFAEHTTQRERVFEKLQGDLEKCFDEAKTGISVERIEEVIFCITCTLKHDEKDILEETAKRHGVKLTVFDMDIISFDLYSKYPGIARDFLGVAIDTGQILTLKEFVEKHKKYKLTTRLDTAFRFREAEVAGAARLLESADLVIISGKAGVGKTRLALKYCEDYREAHPECEVRCIYNRGIDFFEDLQISFSENGNFLIFTDDANRLSGFEHVIDLIRSHRTDQQFKVIATVRDYAVDLIREKARSLGDFSFMELQPLDDEQISQILKDEYGIRNDLFLERISRISHGNPRLAIMAAEVVKKTGTFQSIYDVSTLYDEYFSSIQRDVEILNEQDAIRVLGILAFLRVLDHSRTEFMDVIERAFGISADIIWKTVGKLHEAEVLDVFEDEVARISDQVLATYFFYLAFFKNKLLDYSALLGYFFPSHRERLLDAIHPVLNSFDSATIIREMAPHIDSIWDRLREAGDDNSLLQLMEMFWYVKKTDTLLYARSLIKELESLPIDVDTIELKAGPDIPSPSLLSVLGLFSNADTDSFRIALDLILDYLAKRPQDAGQVLYLLTDRLSFTHHSQLQGFRIQSSVIEVLWERYLNRKDQLFARVFIKVCEEYLRLRGDTTECMGGHRFSIITFRLPATRELLSLRESILKRLLSLYAVDELKKQVLGVITNYVSCGYEVDDREVLAKDSEVLLGFLDSNLDPNDYGCCSLVQRYIELLQDHGLQVNEALRHRFQNKACSISKLLLIDRHQKEILGLDYEEYLRLRRAKIEEHFGTYAVEDYMAFFEDCKAIQKELRSSHMDYQLSTGIMEVLLALIARDLDAFVRVLELYLEQGDALKINPVPIVEKLVTGLGAFRTREIIEGPTYSTKRVWMFAWFYVLPSEQVTKEDLEQLYDCYRSADPTELPRDYDYLIKYRPYDKQVVPKVAEMVLGKVIGTRYCVHVFSMLFNPHADVNKTLKDQFAENLDVLKRGYLSVDDMDRHEDYDGHTFAKIMDLESNFIMEYLEHMFEQRDWRDRANDDRDYSFIWARADYDSVMTQVVDYIFNKEKGEQPMFAGTYLKIFFLPARNREIAPEIMARQDAFLKMILKRRGVESDLIRVLFSVIAYLSPDRRREFIRLFLENSERFEDFEKLPLEPGIRSFSGSEVPILREEMAYLESLLPLLNTARRLQHRQFLERRINAIGRAIQRERKADFID